MNFSIVLFIAMALTRRSFRGRRNNNPSKRDCGDECCPKNQKNNCCPDGCCDGKDSYLLPRSERKRNSFMKKSQQDCDCGDGKCADCNPQKHKIGCNDKDCKGCKDKDCKGCKDKDCNGCNDKDCNGCNDKDCKGCKDKDCKGCNDKDCKGCKGN